VKYQPLNSRRQWGVSPLCNSFSWGFFCPEFCRDMSEPIGP
jgi:hypothetical protein